MHRNLVQQISTLGLAFSQDFFLNESTNVRLGLGWEADVILLIIEP